MFSFDIGGSLAVAAMSSRGFQLIGKACVLRYVNVSIPTRGLR